jgi:hypothetical protein
VCSSDLLPLIRGANRLSIGHDEEAWNDMLTTTAG